MVGNHKDSPHLGHENTWQSAGGFKGRLVKTIPKCCFFCHFYVKTCQKVQTRFAAKYVVPSILIFAGAPFVYNSPRSFPGLNLNGHGLVQVKGPQIDGGNHFEETRFYPKNPMLINCIAIIMFCSHKSHAMFGNIWPIVLSVELQNQSMSSIEPSKNFRSPGLWTGPKLQPALQWCNNQSQWFPKITKRQLEDGVDIENTSKENIDRSSSIPSWFILNSLCVLWGSSST